MTSRTQKDKGGSVRGDRGQAVYGHLIFSRILKTNLVNVGFSSRKAKMVSSKAGLLNVGQKVRRSQKSDRAQAQDGNSMMDKLKQWLDVHFLGLTVQIVCLFLIVFEMFKTCQEWEMDQDEVDSKCDYSRNPLLPVALLTAILIAFHMMVDYMVFLGISYSYCILHLASLVSLAYCILQAYAHIAQEQ